MKIRDMAQILLFYVLVVPMLAVVFFTPVVVQYTQPVMAQKTEVFVGLSYDAGWLNTDAVYATARGNAATSSDFVFPVSTDVGVGQSFTVGNYFVYRASVWFDTSSIPAASTIVSAELQLLNGSKSVTGDDFTLRVVPGTGLGTTPVVADFGDLFNNTTDYGTIATTDIVNGHFFSITLTAAGEGAINKAGNTDFGLRSEEDINNSTPVGAEWMTIYLSEAQDAWRPRLTVSYYYTPTLSTQDPSETSISTAILRGYVTDDGGGAYLRFQHGTTENNHSGYTDDSNQDIYGGNPYAAQCFTTTSAYTIDAVLLRLRGVGAPPGNVVVDIFSTAGGDPNASMAGGTASLAAASITTDVLGDWYHFDIGDVVLNNATMYAVVVTLAGGDAANKVQWRYEAGAGDVGNYLNINTGAWGGDSGHTTMFACCSAVTSTTWSGSEQTTGTYYTETIGDGVPGGDTPLAVTTTYRYRVQGYNTHTGVGAPVSGDWVMFTTSSSVEAPSNLLAIGNRATEISLSWVKGEGSYRTLILYKAGSYPSSYGDPGAYQAYFDILTSTVVINSTTTPVAGGTTYYFMGWGYAPGSPSPFYSATNVTAIITTPAGTLPVNPFELPGADAGWTSEADASGLADSFFYPFFFNAATAMGMPTGTVFLMFGIAISCALGLFAFVISKNTLFTLFFITISLIACTFAFAMPVWIVFGYIIFAITIGYLLKAA